MRRTFSRRAVAGTILITLFVGGAGHAGEAPKDVQAQVNALQDALVKVNTLLESQQKKLDEQQQRIAEQEKTIRAYKNLGKPLGDGPAGPSAEILARLDNVERQAAQAVKTASRPKASDSSPYIGAAVDTAFRYFDGDNGKAGDRPSGNDFNIRGAELIFYADVDPFFKTYMVLNATPDASANDEAVPSLEEAAISTTCLPHVTLKGGRFFVPFGRLSMIHDHDLPFVSRPSSIDNYVGGESQGQGLMASSVLPISHFFQVSGGVFNKIGAEFPLLNPVDGTDATNSRRSSAEMTYFLKMLTSFDIGDAHTFELGASAVEVPDHEIRRNLTNLEFTYKWHPSGQSLPQKLVWGTEIMRNEQRSQFTTTATDALGNPIDKQHRESITGYGGYSYVEYFFDRRWSFGPRVDLFQPVTPRETVLPDDPRKATRNTYEQSYSLFLTYKFSEFGRMRLEATHKIYTDRTAANELLFQWTVFWGAHTHGFDMR